MLELYAIADGQRTPGPGDPAVVICMDEFGPLNLQPHPGKQWAPASVGPGVQVRPRRRRRRATYTRPHGVRHLLAGYDLSTRTDDRVGQWAAANNVELAYVPFYGSWLNRIEAQFTALRYFALDGTDHASHREQASMIRRYIAWRNRHVTDPKLRKVVRRAETIKRAKVA